MEFSLKAKTFRDMMAAITPVRDEIRLNFYNEGMRILALDPANIASVNLLAHKSLFTKYDVESKSQLNVNVSSIIKVLRNLGREDDIILTDEGDILWMVIKGGHKRIFKVPILGYTETPTGKPRVSYKGSCKLLVSGLETILEDIKQAGDEVIFDWTGSELQITDGEKKVMSVLSVEEGKTLISIQDLEPASIKVSFGYIYGMIKAVKGFSDVVVLNFEGTEKPLHMSFVTPYPILLEYWLARKL